MKTMLIIASGGSLALGAFLITIKALSGERDDAQGFLHERFFLLPLGVLFIGLGAALLMNA